MELPSRMHACSFVDFSSLRDALTEQRFLPATGAVPKAIDGLSKPVLKRQLSNDSDSGSVADKCHDQAVKNIIGTEKHEDDLGDSDDARLARRRYLNKLAAQRCREKKRAHADELKSETERLECRNTELKHSVKKLLRQKDELVFLLKTHAQTFHPGEDILKGAVNVDFCWDN